MIKSNARKIVLTSNQRMIKSEFMKEQVVPQIKIRKINKFRKNEQLNKQNMEISPMKIIFNNNLVKTNNFVMKKQTTPSLSYNPMKINQMMLNLIPLNPIIQRQGEILKNKNFKIHPPENKKTQLNNKLLIKSKQDSKNNLSKIVEIEKKQESITINHQMYKPQKKDMIKKSSQLFQKPESSIIEQIIPKANQNLKQFRQTDILNNHQKQLPVSFKQHQNKQIQTKKQQVVHVTQKTSNQHIKQPNVLVKNSLIGLQNIGNSCYMNAILQCLFHLPNFNGYFLSDLYQSKLKSKNDAKVVEEYAKLIKSITKKSETTNLIANCVTINQEQNPSALKDAIGQRNYQFSTYKQQDAHQFLIQLLEEMSQDLKQKQQIESFENDQTNKLAQKSKLQWKKYLCKENSYINDVFGGQLLTIVQCENCGHKIQKFSSFWDIQLCFENENEKQEIVKMIQNFLKKQNLDQYQCQKCQKKNSCRKQTLFSKLPSVLIIHLKRFQYDQQEKGLRLSTQVSYDQRLKLNQFIHQQLDQDKSEYQICGVVKHTGSLDFGHYKAQCKQMDNKWYEYNDNDVSQCKINGSIRSDSDTYLLFYSKRNIYCLLKQFLIIKYQFIIYLKIQQ